MKQLLACRSLIVAVGLVLSACGGSVADTDPGTAELVATPEPSALAAYDAVIDPAAMDTAHVVVDRLGPDAAFAAVVLALERGYTTEQVIAAAASIEPHGAIPTVDPENDQAVIFFAWSGGALRGAQVLAAGVFAAGESVTPDEFLEAMRGRFEPTDFLTDQPTVEETLLLESEMTELFIAGILALVDVGYSLEQVVEGIVFGELRWGVGRVESNVRDRYACSVLANEAGELIMPKRSAPAHVRDSERCREAIDNRTMWVYVGGVPIDTETTTTTDNTSSTTNSIPTTTTVPEAAVFPRTYEGTSEQRLSWSKANGLCTISTTTMRITLHADGNVSGTVTGTETFHTTTDNENNVTTVVCLEPSARPYSFEVTGTHEGQDVTLETAELNPWVQGPFSSELMTLSYTRVSERGLLGNETYEVEFVLTPVKD